LAQACADRIDLVLQLSKRKNRKLRSDDGRSVGTNIGMAPQDLADGAALGQVDDLIGAAGVPSRQGDLIARVQLPACD
jgi:hypothetical protein